eukprot:CAMPEP_0113544712 /NCGR_PEP_ID=MMETSP0015_2-20120614/10857_1 /TAXON_ID=2838 /ORGANISM="Odontella" /LENGTH=48 /DNA_ID=CAMNT_0000444995 /DNA_START=45 /DNA_END=188 /DNA_ORIENTATION=- /assembly_acc=CAM_ASM_000160
MRFSITVAATVASSLLASADAGAVELTEFNFDKETAGKNAFVKFQAPW